jgi:drug/metabolite transporter (DMT)-like permease
VLGVFLFLGISLQQVGIISTTAGNAGFITGLYAVFVPVFGVVLGHRFRVPHFLAGVLALVGLYLLCIEEGFILRYGDALVLLGAVAWAVHVLLISNLGQQRLSVCFSVIQFYICAILSLCLVPFTGEVLTAGISEAYLAIGYASLISVAGGYTLQVVAQKEAHPSYASIILSLEAVFAVAGGYLFLAEKIPFRGIIGAALMLVAMGISSRGGRKVVEGPAGAVRGRGEKVS